MRPFLCFSLIQTIYGFISHTNNVLSRTLIHGKPNQDGNFEFEAEELALLQEEAERNKEEWQRALNEKLEEWLALKKAGELDKLRDQDDEDVIVDLVANLDKESKRLRQKRRGESGESETSEGIQSNGSLFKLEEKFKSVGGRRGSSLGVYNLLLEMRDKGELYDDLIVRSGLALARLDSEKLAHKGFKLLREWNTTGDVAFPKDYFKQYANSCLSKYQLFPAGERIVTDLEVDGIYSKADFACGFMCADLHRMSGVSGKNSKVDGKEGGTDDGAETPSSSSCPSFRTSLEEWLSEPARLWMAGAGDLNMLIRVLGKYHRVDDIFAVLDAMRTCGSRSVRPDDETLEFLGNAVISTVGRAYTAKTMKDLPSPDTNIPEIVFTGRSNVGKSSLVNMLCNRKALASTSATPGHTTQFHFFRVNEDDARSGSDQKDASIDSSRRSRSKSRMDNDGSDASSLPSFHLVDVPGLGYAEADAGRQTSWRSLLERYLSVRTSLAAVFHLVDCRNGLTQTDKSQIDMTQRALEARKEAGEPAFKYCIVLTKGDKAGPKAVNKTRREVKEGTQALAMVLGLDELDLVQSSSVSRSGKEDLLRRLYQVGRGR